MLEIRLQSNLFKIFTIKSIEFSFMILVNLNHELYYLFSKMQLKTFIFPKIAIAFLIWFTLSSHSIII
jgi:hypothetical protein